MHPSHCIQKYYRVHLDRPFREKHGEEMLRGIDCGGEVLRASNIHVQTGHRRQLSIILTEGKNRHIRRMMVARGYGVEFLERYRIGQFLLDPIQRGKYRQLDVEQRKKLLTNT
jgi:pseudouridine synthase